MLLRFRLSPGGVVPHITAARRMRTTGAVQLPQLYCAILRHVRERLEARGKL
jgi:hypothetical protein